MIPKDPVILLGFINMKLRDIYQTLDALCDDLNASEEEIKEILQSIGYRYNEEQNAFI